MRGELGGPGGPPLFWGRQVQMEMTRVTTPMSCCSLRRRSRLLVLSPSDAGLRQIPIDRSSSSPRQDRPTAIGKPTLAFERGECTLAVPWSRPGELARQQGHPLLSPPQHLFQFR